MLGYLDMNLRGAGQVFFQNNPWTGLIILAAISGALMLRGI
jgi:urea transporter